MCGSLSEDQIGPAAIAFSWPASEHVCLGGTRRIAFSLGSGACYAYDHLVSRLHGHDKLLTWPLAHELCTQRACEQLWLLAASIRNELELKIRVLHLPYVKLS